LEIPLFKSFPFALCLLLVSALPSANAGPVACPDLKTAVQVGTCPTEEQLKYTFVGFCSDDAKAYRGETDVCTDFQQYRKLKNTVLWESADGSFDAYVSCDLPKDTLQRASPTAIKLGKQGKVTQLICSYPNGVNFIYRTRAQCQLDAKDASADCAANPASCKAQCN
jgi:hypothetical protein